MRKVVAAAVAASIHYSILHIHFDSNIAAMALFALVYPHSIPWKTFPSPDALCLPHTPPSSYRFLLSTFPAQAAPRARAEA